MVSIATGIEVEEESEDALAVTEKREDGFCYLSLNDPTISSDPS